MSESEDDTKNAAWRGAAWRMAPVRWPLYLLHACPDHNGVWTREARGKSGASPTGGHARYAPLAGHLHADICPCCPDTPPRATHPPSPSPFPRHKVYNLTESTYAKPSLTPRGRTWTRTALSTSSCNRGLYASRSEELTSVRHELRGFWERETSFARCGGIAFARTILIGRSCD